jgi:hypothetical protein
MVRVIAQFAHPLRCHSIPELGRLRYPTRSKRNVSVKNGIDKRRATSRTEGERRSKRGCEESRWVVSVRTEDVEWIFCGSDKRRRPVKSASARGIRAKRRKLEKKDGWM